MILSCIKGNNADLISDVEKIYLSPGDKIADVTFGNGVFWKKVQLEKYNFYPSDIKTGVDFNNLPYENNTFDVVVFDPPYLHYVNKTSTMNKTYNNHNTTGKMKQRDILKMYYGGLLECSRVLKNNGLLWVKCMDVIEGRQQYWNHIDIYVMAGEMGLRAEDMFILQRHSTLNKHSTQLHSSKNHSYLWIFKKMKKSPALFKNIPGELAIKRIV